MKPTEHQIRIAAQMQASNNPEAQPMLDDQLCVMFKISPEDLERFRPVVQQGRAQGFMALQYEAQRTSAKRPRRIRAAG